VGGDGCETVIARRLCAEAMNMEKLMLGGVSLSGAASVQRKSNGVAATTHATAAKAPEAPAETRNLDAVIRQIDTYLRSVNRSLEFRVDSISGRTVVSVRDSATGDLIRQIPTEEVLHLAQTMHEDTLVLLDESV
jgi:flagellar protein FlaG